MEGPTTTPLFRHLPEDAKVKLTLGQVRFLQMFVPYVMPRWIPDGHLVEIAVLWDFAMKHRAKIMDGRACKIKIKAHELISLKRLLRIAIVPGPWHDDQLSLLATIDQLTVDVH